MAVWVIAIAGGSGAGKTTLSRRVVERLGPARCVTLNQDSYYIDQSARFKEDGGDVNFDHPASLEFSLLAKHLRCLKRGEAVEVPVYDFASHTRRAKGELVEPRPVVVVDGTLLLSQGELLPLFDVAVFIDVDTTLRYDRRLSRDTRERGREAAGVRAQWDNHVQPMHEAFVGPSGENATYRVSDDAELERCVEELVRRFT
jgi:uridine kinase